MKRAIINTHSLSSIGKVTLLILLFILIGFEIVPSSSIKETQYIVVAGFQRANSQFIEKAAYVIQYSPVSERAQAVHDLQSTLAVFQQEQNLLWTNSDSEIQGLLNQAQPDYLTIVAASHILLSNPTDVATLIQINILLPSDRSFFSTMNTLVLILEQKAEFLSSEIFAMKLIIIGICSISAIFIAAFDHYEYKQKQKKNTIDNVGSERASISY